MNSEVRIQKSEGDGGFTLIELSIVILIMLVILGIVAINFASQMSYNKLHSTAREISAMMRNAKALTYKGDRQTVEFNIDEQSYGLVGKGSKKIPEEMHLRVADPVSGEIDKGTWQVVFSPEGTASGGVIILSSPKGTVHLKIDPIVGSVKIGDGQK